MKCWLLSVELLSRTIPNREIGEKPADSKESACHRKAASPKGAGAREMP
ncbi:hypothetical protein [Kamptonema formosum]|nr:hypothetical protein [Oscillatoria sp. PCC 10802]